MRRLKSASATLMSTSDAAGSTPQPVHHFEGSLSGSILGSYEILSPLGFGGMGEIYLARDTRLGRSVAVKLLPNAHRLDPERIRRFEREAQAASALNHPNIVTVYDIGECDLGRFIVMEQVVGQTLREVLDSGPGLDSLGLLGGQIAKALAVAHSAGIVHRDIKPANIMIRKDGYLKVLDFGLARLLQGDSASLDDTNPGRVIGTVAYMSPEQARGENPGAPSDVFSLGIIFYEIATGKHPFQESSPMATLQAIHSREPVRPSSLNPQVRSEISNLIMAMLDKDASRRPTATEVERALIDGCSKSNLSSAELGGRRLHNLPVQRTPLIGRNAERSALQPLLNDPEIRLITLSGPGGTGKTRLAIQAAADAIGSFPGGICFVNLAPLSNPKLVISAVAQALGIRESPGRLLIDVVKDYMAGTGPILLVLDNFEQVAAAAEDIAEILDSTPGVKAMVTSRTVLHVYGEHEFSVPPLPLPEMDAGLPPGRLLDFPSVALFVQRAVAAKPEFALSTKNSGAVLQICRRLDGLPLAIEMAAARVKIFPPDALLARLANRLDVLTAGAKDMPERQRTLRRAIDWSHDLLSPPEQKLFRRLSVFCGSFTLEAAEAVCDAGEDLGIGLLDAITSLVDKSLLGQTASGEAEPRFSMLETIREYGRERLEQYGEREFTRRAHAAYCLVLAEEGTADMSPAQRDDWLSRCDADHDNFRGAIEYLIESANAEWALRLGSALFWFWEAREHLTEGRSSLALLLGVPGANLLKVHYASALFGAAVLADVQLDSAEALMSASLEIQRELGDKQGMATVESALGIIANKAGRFSKARSHIERALLLWKELGSGRFVLGLSNLAKVAKNQGDYAIARAAYEATMDAFRSAGDTRGTAVALNGLGDIAEAQNAFPDARRLYEDSLSKFQQIGDLWGVAGVLRDLGNLACRSGDYAAASGSYKEALAVFHTLGHRRGMAVVLEHLAVCAMSNGRPDCALRLVSAAATMRESLGISLSLAERHELDQCIHNASEKLSKAEQTAAWGEGRSMSTDQVLEYVRTN